MYFRHCTFYVVRGTYLDILICQTLNSISAEKNSTVIFPLPIGVMMMMMVMMMTMLMVMTMMMMMMVAVVFVNIFIPFYFRFGDKPDGELAC